MTRSARSARFEVSWVDDYETHPNGPPEGRDSRDYIILELLPDDMRRLHKQLALSIQMDDAQPVGDQAYLCIQLHGKAKPQAADRKDGTRTYPPSLLSEEVLAESPRPDRWRAEQPEGGS
jgi:hypothetical protein